MNPIEINLIDAAKAEKRKREPYVSEYRKRAIKYGETIRVLFEEKHFTLKEIAEWFISKGENVTYSQVVSARSGWKRINRKKKVKK